jgi:hypothetical protein
MPAFKHNLGSSTSFGGDENPNVMTGLPELDATLNKFPTRLEKDNGTQRNERLQPNLF